MASRKKKGSAKAKLLLTLLAAAAAAAVLFVSKSGVIDKKFFDDLFGGSTQKEMNTAEGELEVTFIDVGQGDSSLILSEDKAVLIDTGEKENGEKICRLLGEKGISSLDCMLLTHPHSDHMGAAAYIIKNFDIKKVIMPKVKDDLVPTTKTYEKFLKAVSEKGLKITAAAPGMEIDAGDGVLKIISPVNDYDDLNNYSAAAVLTHGQDSFLFTGDIEKEAETDIMESGAFLDIDVLKVAHHGSKSSSSKDFLEAVSPEYAVIMCDGESYGHPHKDTVERLKNYTDDIYRTDLDGTVTFTSDKNGLKAETEKKRK